MKKKICQQNQKKKKSKIQKRKNPTVYAQRRLNIQVRARRNHNLTQRDHLRREKQQPTSEIKQCVQLHARRSFRVGHSVAVRVFEVLVEDFRVRAAEMVKLDKFLGCMRLEVGGIIIGW